jgi:hypothetical protein
VSRLLLSLLCSHAACTDGVVRGESWRWRCPLDQTRRHGLLRFGAVCGRQHDVAADRVSLPRRKKSGVSAKAEPSSADSLACSSLSPCLSPAKVKLLQTLRQGSDMPSLLDTPAHDLPPVLLYGRSCMSRAHLVSWVSIESFQSIVSATQSHACTHSQLLLSQSSHRDISHSRVSHVYAIHLATPHSLTLLRCLLTALFRPTRDPFSSLPFLAAPR